MASMSERVQVIGGGLAGCEAAWQLARLGIPVALHEMRPLRGTDAHRTATLAELVCSNSFRSDDAETNAVGLLHEELRRGDSVVMAAADRNQVPAGGALAVDRHGFAAAVQEAVEAQDGIELRREEVETLPGPDRGLAIVATGPLTSASLAGDIRRATRSAELAFFDAIAPIVHRETIDFDIAWFQSRYDKAGPGGDDAAYINCPLSRDEYEAFVDNLLAARTVAFRDFEKATPYFEGCLPIEVMAERGRDTPRFRPDEAGRVDGPPQRRAAHAVVQLRQDNALGSLFNIVGFQTKLAHGEQKRVLRTIPGLGRAGVRAAGRHPPQHFHQQPGPARRRAAPAPAPASSLRGPDHRRRGVCRKRRDRSAGRALRRRREPRPRHRAASRHDRPGRPVEPRHRGRRLVELPAHELQFRALPPSRRAARGLSPRQGRAPGLAGGPGAARSGGLARVPDALSRRRTVRADARPPPP